MIRRRRLPHNRRAMTLIELLVVIGIIVLLLAVAIPLMKLMSPGSRVREASRAFNAHIASIQSRAAERQRPYGLWIERSELHSGTATTIFAAEVPAPYAGDFVGAGAFVQTISPMQGRAIFSQDGTTADPGSISLTRLVKVGDMIRFDYKGPYYLILNVIDNADPTPDEVIFNYNGTPPLPSSTVPVSYQVQRQPRRSIVGTMQFPTATVIDLTWSGLGNSGVQFRPTPDPSDPTNTTYDKSPIIIMFAPTGRVDFVYAGNQRFRPQGPIHLLLGQDDQLDPALVSLDPDKDLNIDDLETIWVSIGQATGTVTNSSNHESTPAAPDPVKAAEARTEARRAHIMRGAS